MEIIENLLVIRARGSTYHDDVLDVRDPSEFWLDFWRILLGEADIGAPLGWAGWGWVTVAALSPLDELPWLALLERDQSRTSC